MSEAARLEIAVQANFDEFTAAWQRMKAQAETESQVTGRRMGEAISQSMKRELTLLSGVIGKLGLGISAFGAGVKAVQFATAALRQDWTQVQSIITELPFGLDRVGQAAIGIRDFLLAQTEVGRLALAVSQPGMDEESRRERQAAAEHAFMRQIQINSDLIEQMHEEEYRQRIEQEKRFEEIRRRNIADSIQYQMEEYERAFEMQQRREEALRRFGVEDQMNALREQIQEIGGISAASLVQRRATAIGSFGFGQQDGARQIVDAQKRVETLTAELVRLQREELELARARQLEGFR